MTNQSPYEQVRFIRDVIKDRADKSQPTFFTVKLESFGSTTPLVQKEQGVLFYDTILQYLMRYDVAALIVELYHGKSNNVKEPFQIFRIPIKRSPVVTLSGFEKKDDMPLTPSETVISPEKHFQTLAENQFNLLRLQYENEVLRKKNKKKKVYIAELEKEIEKYEREKNKSLGNITLGAVGANALENFAKSQFGIGLLKKVFGAKDEVLQGLLGETEQQQPKEAQEQNSKAAIEPEAKPLTERERQRQAIQKVLTDYFEKTDDGFLRLYYELIILVADDLQLLRWAFLQVRAVKEARKKQPIKQQQPVEEEDTEDQTDATAEPPDDS